MMVSSYRTSCQSSDRSRSLRLSVLWFLTIILLSGWFTTTTLAISTLPLKKDKDFSGYLQRRQEGREQQQQLFRSTASIMLSVRGGGAVPAARSSPKAASASPSTATATTSPSTGGAGRATIPATVFNLVKAIVGVGVLSLPAGVAAFGNAPSAVLPAVALITIIGLLSGYGFALIAKVCAYTNSRSYREAWEKSVGVGSSWIPAWSTTCKTFLACLAFSMVLGDTFASLLSLPRQTALLSVTLGLLLPLCWMKNLTSLAPFSLVGVLGMLYTAVTMTMRYVDGSYRLPVFAQEIVKHVTEDGSTTEEVVTKVVEQAGALLSSVPEHLQPQFGQQGLEAVLNPKSLILVCMLSTAYMAHFNAPKMYLELRNNTLPRFYQVVAYSFGASIVLMGWMTAMGFLTFGGRVSGLVLNNYATSDTLMMASRVAVAVSLVFSYPLAFQGCRDGFLDLLKIKSSSATVQNITTLILLAILTLLALTLKDVSFVLAFGGATLGNALTYVYPALMYQAACRKQGRKESVGIFIANVSALLGLVMGAIGAKMAIDKVTAH